MVSNDNCGTDVTHVNQGVAGGFLSVHSPLSPQGLGAQSSLFLLQVAPSHPDLHWHTGPEAAKEEKIL